MINIDQILGTRYNVTSDNSVMIRTLNESGIIITNFTGLNLVFAAHFRKQNSHFHSLKRKTNNLK